MSFNVRVVCVRTPSGVLPMPLAPLHDASCVRTSCPCVPATAVAARAFLEELNKAHQVTRSGFPVDPELWRLEDSLAPAPHNGAEHTAIQIAIR